MTSYGVVTLPQAPKNFMVATVTILFTDRIRHNRITVQPRLQVKAVKMSSELTFTRMPKTEDNTSCLEIGDMELMAPMKANSMVIQG